VMAEIEKIAAYAKGERITRADIDAVAAPVLEAQVFDMTRAVSRGDFDRAAELLGQLLRKIEDGAVFLCQGVQAASGLLRVVHGVDLQPQGLEAQNAVLVSHDCNSIHRQKPPFLTCRPPAGGCE